MKPTIIWAKSGYSKGRRTLAREERPYVPLSLEEAKRLTRGRAVSFIDRFGDVREARVSGQPQTWKTRPGDCRIPLKYGFYECFQAWYKDHEPFAEQLIRELTEAEARAAGLTDAEVRHGRIPA